jgi:molecular chaperone DnaK
MQRLKEAAEKAKIELSTLITTNVNLPFLSSGPDGPVHMDLELTRARLESLCVDLLDRLAEPTLTAMRDAKLLASDLDQVLLVGGSTRMPAVQSLVRKMFGRDPVSFVGLNPEEAVAMGAALQGGVLNAEVEGVLLLDVTPLSLGIETVGGVVAHVIEKNTTLPTQARQVFTTSSDGQTVVNIRVYQGETRDAAHSRLLGNFQLSGIPRAPKGVPQIEVMFDVDVNGIVHVEAVERNTGIQQQIKLGSASALNLSEIEAMSGAFRNRD